MKGIILAGGAGTRLYPLTLAVSKQLVPVYDKPMIYYPLTTLMMAGMREILIITTPEDQPSFQRLLRRRPAARASTSSMPCSRSPTGWPRRSSSAATFMDGEGVALALGDNLFYGGGLRRRTFAAPPAASQGATVFGYHVNDPERYGVVEFDGNGRGGQPRGEAARRRSRRTP